MGGLTKEQSAAPYPRPLQPYPPQNGENASAAAGRGGGRCGRRRPERAALPAAAGPDVHRQLGPERPGELHHRRGVRHHARLGLVDHPQSAGQLPDVWWGGYDDEYDTGYLEDGNAAFVNLNVGPRYPDTVQDLFLIGTNQGMADTTRFRLRRRYETGDRNDVDILKGVTYTVIWSYAADDAPQSEAIRGGTASITFRPVA